MATPRKKPDRKSKLLKGLTAEQQTVEQRFQIAEERAGTLLKSKAATSSAPAPAPATGPTPVAAHANDTATAPPSEPASSADVDEIFIDLPATLDADYPGEQKLPDGQEAYKLASIDRMRISRIQRLCKEGGTEPSRAQVVKAALRLFSNQAPDLIRSRVAAEHVPAGRKPRDYKLYQQVAKAKERLRSAGERGDLDSSLLDLAESMNIEVPRRISVRRLHEKLKDLAEGQDIDVTTRLHEWMGTPHPLLFDKRPLDVITMPGGEACLLELLSLTPLDQRGDDGSRWVIRETSRENRYRYSDTPDSRNAWDLLSFPRMRDAVAELRKRYADNPDALRIRYPVPDTVDTQLTADTRRRAKA